MKQYYYLVSQLPNVSSSMEKNQLPVTEKYYRDLCSRFLDKSDLTVLENLSLVPPRTETTTGSAFLDVWYRNERNLRFALAQVRAQKMKKDSPVVPGSCTADIMQTARTAVGMDSPLSAEKFLFEYRLALLDSLRPIQQFSTDSVFAYGIRLLLIQRMKKFDAESGTASYHKIYNTILGETT